MKKIGIIGSGVVAKALGAGFLKHGYQVTLGTRDASKLVEWQLGEGVGAQIGSFADAAKFGDIVVLAVKGTAAKNALEIVGAENLANKTIIDTTNPIADAPPTNGVLKFFTNLDKSLMEELQETVPEANFVKAFSSVGNAFMVNPTFESKPTMFICGNSEEAKKEVSVIIDQFGWESADFGMIESARAIEPLCMLWCIPGFRSNQWAHAFKLLKL
ncbi:NADPH-dependent F420 reductase [Flavobacterium soyangense]|uniref:NAD(P)-binding domain-containing protein n=1 Tax=Flavobacterium soyangense TaxID=2023265 RepID=A0A930UBG3_9FLAO|nr:NAD(P)-binding domain-containing protein [Flavobacterium soyangense]MBF2708995.1 NAD(P)-binding domain-containing protein [Flavobacterium soyangense]